MRQRSDEWHAFRKKHIGASEAGIVWKETPSGWYRLWEEKMGLSENTFMNDAMRRGVELEEKARAWFNNKMGMVFWPDVKEDPKNKFLSASVDGISLDGKFLWEVKCPTSRRILEEAEKGDFHLDHYCQVQQQMHVYDLPSAYYHIYFDDDDSHVFEIKRDKKWFKEYIEKASRFWYHVEKKIPPLDEQEDPEFLDIENRIIALLNREKELKDELKELGDLKDTYIESAKSITQERSAIGAKTFFLKSKRKGNVDYSIVPELEGVNLEPYRKKDIISWKFSLKKDFSDD